MGYLGFENSKTRILIRSTSQVYVLLFKLLANDEHSTKSKVKYL